MTIRCGVVVAHGRLGQGFLTALERVMGHQDNVWTVSNEGMGGEELEREIQGLLAERGAGREAILFSDLDGGSCGQACRRLLASGAVRAVFYGINLPLLIEFVLLQDESFETLAAAVLAKSRDALGIHE